MKKNIFNPALCVSSLALFIFLGQPVFAFGSHKSFGLSPSGAEMHWEFAGWYGGGCYPGLATDPLTKGRLYLVSDVSGVWRSDDRGENWVFMNRGLSWLVGSAVMVAPSDSNVVYFATEKGLFYSLNAGSSWTKVDTKDDELTFKRPASYRPIAVSESNPARLCVGTAKGDVLCSSDYGKKWKKISKDSAFPSIGKPVTAITFVDHDNVIYASTAMGLYKYHFASRVWTPLLNGKNVTDFIVSTFSPSIIYVAGEPALLMTKDGGKFWRESSPVPRGTTFRVLLSEVVGDDAKVYVSWKSGTNGELLVTKDDGKTWAEVAENFVPDLAGNPTRVWAKPTWNSITSIAADPFDKNILYRTDWWGVWRSDDGGRTWVEKIKGAPNTVGSDITFTPAGALFVATMDNGLLKSDDMGKTYQAVFPSKEYSPDAGGHVWRVVAGSDNKIIATSSPWSVGLNQAIVSSNGGGSFEIVRVGLPRSRPKMNAMWGSGYPKALAVDPKDPNNVYLGIDGDDGGGLFISQDGGLNWARSRGQPGSLRIYHGLLVDPIDSNRLYWAASGKDGGIYVSPDRGATWSLRFDRSTSILDLCAGADGLIYAAADYKGSTVLVSRDHGKSWDVLAELNRYGGADAIAVSPTDSKVIAVSTGYWWGPPPSQIFLSKDGGKKWIDATGDLPPGLGAAAMIFTHEGQYLYISRNAGGVYRLKVSSSV